MTQGVNGTNFKRLLGGDVGKEEAAALFATYFPGTDVTAENALSVLEWIDESMDLAQLSIAEAEKAVIGQKQVIESVMTCILSGGNPLLVGNPGLGKTMLATTLGTVLGLDTKRIQGTPDLMPSDITGSEILTEEDGKRAFKFVEGPVFAQLLFGDELNRASPRTQSALLQAMQERKVTVNGGERDLPQPYHVIGAQNPLEQDGTYPLPEAQLDRFLLLINFDYPDRDAERKIMLGTTSTALSFNQLTDPDYAIKMPSNHMLGAEKIHEVLNADRIMRIQHFVRKMPLGDDVTEAILDIVRVLRPDAEPELKNPNLQSLFNDIVKGKTEQERSVMYGPGPRACQALALLVRTKAFLRGDLAPNIEDIIDVMPMVLGHRMREALSARTRQEPETVGTILQKVARVYS